MARRTHEQPGPEGEREGEREGKGIEALEAEAKEAEKKEPELEQEELSPEELEAGRELDKELAQIIRQELKAEEVDQAKIDRILEQLKTLGPREKAKIMKDLEAEGKLNPEEMGEKEKVRAEYQEEISEYERSIDDLVSRAKALGIDVPSGELRDYLEKFRNIESETGEEMDWQEYFDQQFSGLKEKIEKLEEAKKGGASPEEMKQLTEKTKEDLAEIFGDLVAKAAEFVVRLAIKIASGLIKGVLRAFRLRS